MQIYIDKGLDGRVMCITKKGAKTFGPVKIWKCKEGKLLTVFNRRLYVRVYDIRQYFGVIVTGWPW